MIKLLRLLIIIPCCLSDIPKKIPSTLTTSLPSTLATTLSSTLATTLSSTLATTLPSTLATTLSSTVPTTLSSTVPTTLSSTLSTTTINYKFCGLKYELIDCSRPCKNGLNSDCPNFYTCYTLTDMACKKYIANSSIKNYVSILFIGILFINIIINF